MKYEEPKSGEWVQPIRCGYKLRCCDCGLVHKMDFRVVDHVADKIMPRRFKVQFRAFRDNRATAAIRRPK